MINSTETMIKQDWRKNGKRDERDRNVMKGDGVMW